jgi:putative Mg2+ transporter-C (MgtC) family protein
VPQSLAEEFSMNISIPFEVLLVRVFGAVVLCGLIGLEREFHKNTAGLRTNMLIGLAAVTFCIITIHMMETMAEGHEAARLDPIRLVEAVTAGIAFLAAGVVVYTRGDVKGLTTGASMWLSAAIGLSAGLGMWPLALVAAGAGIVVFGRSGACRWPPASRRIDGHQPKRKRSASGSLPPLTAAATISAAIWLKVMPLPPKPITA